MRNAFKVGMLCPNGLGRPASTLEGGDADLLFGQGAVHTANQVGTKNDHPPVVANGARQACARIFGLLSKAEAFPADIPQVKCLLSARSAACAG
jgi:hypothetical protein